MARDVVQQRGRSLVDPLDVVEDDGRGSHRRNLPQQTDHRVEQPGSISGFRRRAHFGKQQAEISRQPVARALAQDLTDNIDPYAIGTRSLGFIGRAAKACPPAEIRRSPIWASTRLLPMPGSPVTRTTSGLSVRIATI